MKLMKRVKQMKRKAAYLPMIILATCAATMFAAYCTQVDFSSHPLDQNETPPAQCTPNFNCPTDTGSCTVGANCTNNVQRQNCAGQFANNGTCTVTPNPQCTAGVDCPTDVGRCTVGGNCTNNVQRQNCSGDFVFNNTCIVTPPNNGDGSFIDSRDNKNYRTVTIGQQIWMAENLNFAGTGMCYNNDESNCATYGRLYTWTEALTACPTDWHLPSDDEWGTLISFVGSNAGTKLKSASGWNTNTINGSGNGTDNHGFSALPGGQRTSTGNFNDVGNHGYWWSTMESGASNAVQRHMNYLSSGVSRTTGNKTAAMSVRCIRN